MCCCDPYAGIICGPHFLAGMRRREEAEQRTVELAESLIAEAEQIANSTGNADTEETQP